MAQFHAMTGLVLGVVCLSMLCNCIDDVTVIDDVIVIDYLSDNVTVSDDVMVVEPSAVSSEFCGFNSIFFYFTVVHSDHLLLH